MKTTSTRARSLAHSLGSGGLKGALGYALLATTAICGLTAAPAMAQSGRPSIHKNVDANGVDLTDGSFNFSLMEGSIGAGEEAIALVRSFGLGGERDNLSVRFSRSVSGGTATIALAFGNAREEFSGASGATSFASAQGSGATLTKIGPSDYRHTDAGGTVTARPQDDGGPALLWRQDIAI